MLLARVTVAGWAAAALVVGAVSTGCSTATKTSSPSPSARVLQRGRSVGATLGL